MDQLIYRRRTKEYIKEVAKRTRKARFTRVADSFVDDLESDFRLMIHRKIHAHPSKGMTLMGDDNH